MIRHASLAALDLPQQTAAFNLVYEDYVVPLRLNEAQMRLHLDAYAIAREHSPVWQDDAGVVALAALGVRGEHGWIGGFGIAPRARGTGLSHRLIDAVIDEARKLGLATVQLEVLTGNPRAIRTYERAGFRITRDLRIFARPVDAPALLIDSDAVDDAEPKTLLQHASELQRAPSPWQRQTPSLAAQPELRGLACRNGQTIQGYVLYQVGETNIRWVDLAARDENAVLRLAAALAERYPGRGMSLLNEPEPGPIGAALEAAGWREALRQHEMVLALERR